MQPPADPARRTPWRPRQIWLFGALVGAAGLAAVVAVVAEGAPLIGRSRAVDAREINWQLPGWVLGSVMLVGVVGAVAIVVMMLSLRGGPGRTSARRRRWPLLVLMFLAMLALIVLIPAQQESKRREDAGSTPPTSVQEGSTVVERGRNPWPAILLAAGVVLALALAANATRRRARTVDATGTGAVEAREEVRQAVVAGLDDLRAEPDPRRAIIAAYSRLLDGLHRAGLPRRPQDTPLEHLGQVLASFDVRPAPVATLTALFDEARFSTHPLGAADKAAAIAALEAAEQDLAGAPAPAGRP